MNKNPFLLSLLGLIFFILISCKASFIIGEYYVENSNTKLIFKENSLSVKENDIPVYYAVLTDKTDIEYIYTITEIRLVEIMEEYKKPSLNIKNEIILKKSSNKENQEEKLLNENSFKINGNFFGTEYEYSLDKEKTNINIINNMYLRDIEANKIKLMKFGLLTNDYELKPENIYDYDIVSETEFLFDKNKNTNSKIPSEFLKKVGLEFSLKIKNDDNQKEEKQKNDVNKKIDGNVSIRAVKITIPEEEFYEYSKPQKMMIFFSSKKKHNPGFRVYLYEKVAEINLKNKPGEQIFYFIDGINNPNSIHFTIDSVYEGLSDKILISEIDFFIE